MTAIIKCNSCPNPIFGFDYISPGVSDESDALNRENRVITQELEFKTARESLFSRLQRARPILSNLYRDCREVDWDGRGAIPVPFVALVEAKKLIAQIPEHFPIPEIIPEVTGGVGLEWYVDPYRVLVLSVAGDGYIYYSGLYGFKNADYGSKPLAGQLDKKIIELLEGVYWEAGA